jgi:hypothetical protein
MPHYQIKVSAKLDHHALHNLSSNPTAKVTEFDNNQYGFYYNLINTRAREEFYIQTPEGYIVSRAHHHNFSPKFEVLWLN